MAYWLFILSMLQWFFCTGMGLPLSSGTINSNPEAIDSTLFIYSVIGLVVLSAILVFGCACCKERDKIINDHGHQNGLAVSSDIPQMSPVTEFTFFQSPQQNQAGIYSDEVIFEPLPDIRPRGSKPSGSQILRPAHFTGPVNKSAFQDWFNEIDANFPRSHLQYVQEVGTGWFGQAIQGEARSIVRGESKTVVVVKILRVDASPTEHRHFLNEVQMYRDLNHANVLKLLGRCLESEPYLIILEHCEKDLKTFLIEHRSFPEKLLQDGMLLRIACNISSGLQYMHEHGYIHSDIASRNCLVSKNNIIKIGDYGTSIQSFKEDYYYLRDIALPVRWCAPESLFCTETTIETKDLSRESNMWSFGVLLWELLEFGKLPYIELSDEEVLQKVLIEKSLKLEQPKTPCVHKDKLYEIMLMCWQLPHERPMIQRVSYLLNHLFANKSALGDSTSFEMKWNSLQPVIQEHNLPHSITPVLQMKFENDFNVSSGLDCSRDCDSVVSSEMDHGFTRDKSPSYGSISTGLDVELATNVSPSLQNLRGSIDDLSFFEENISNKNNSRNATLSEDQINQISNGIENSVHQDQEVEMNKENVDTNNSKIDSEILIRETKKDSNIFVDSLEKNKCLVNDKDFASSIIESDMFTSEELCNNSTQETTENASGDFSLENEAIKSLEESSVFNTILADKPDKLLEFFKLTAIESDGSTDSEGHFSLQEDFSLSSLIRSVEQEEHNNHTTLDEVPSNSVISQNNKNSDNIENASCDALKLEIAGESLFSKTDLSSENLSGRNVDNIFNLESSELLSDKKNEPCSEVFSTRSLDKSDKPDLDISERNLVKDLESRDNISPAAEINLFSVKENQNIEDSILIFSENTKLNEEQVENEVIVSPPNRNIVQSTLTEKSSSKQLPDEVDPNST